MDCFLDYRTVNEKVSGSCTVERHDGGKEPIESGDMEDSVTIGYTDIHHHELNRVGGSAGGPDEVTTHWGHVDISNADGRVHIFNRDDYLLAEVAECVGGNRSCCSSTVLALMLIVFITLLVIVPS